MDDTLMIIAGPCSVDQTNISEIREIAHIKINGQKAIAGVRVVGLKSRTALSADGQGMGMDYDTLIHNMKVLQDGGSVNDFPVYPSIQIAKEIADATGTMIASEIMLPHLQLPVYGKLLADYKFMAWSPAVNQLGWPLLETAKYAEKYGWYVGIKNGKWTGATIDTIDSTPAPIEKVWQGLASYSEQIGNRTILIHRGFDIPEKGDHRNLPLHKIAERVKAQTGQKMFFDPSHTFGPKHRDKIVEGTIKAMQMKTKDEYLYDGILIEAGTSQTDTEQHITIDELKNLAGELAKFRRLISPRDL